MVAVGSAVTVYSRAPALGCQVTSTEEPTCAATTPVGATSGAGVAEGSVGGFFGGGRPGQATTDSRLMPMTRDFIGPPYDRTS